MEFELAPAVLESAQLQGEELDVSALISSLPNGKLEGPGRLVFKSGCTYEGELVQAQMHGNGKIVFPDGLEFEGTFERNTIQGSGILRWPGGATYSGQVACGLRHGQGRMSFTDSAVVYEGGWHRGKRHGSGKITLNSEGTHCYQGDWEDDKKCGQGVMRYSNGDQYTGAWAGDVKCGQGVMEWSSKQQRYQGSWARNMPNGAGTHVWFKQLVSEPSPANHAMLLLFNRYEGHFQDGQRSGYGVLHYATGARYEGFWQADLKQGPGMFIFENGEVWQGSFFEDHPELAEGEVFAPKGPGICMQVDDLVDEEEVVAAAARGLANVMMVYNSDLRALYDKYCKRPSLHLKGKKRPCFTMVTCQVWELLGDVRLITAATPLARCDQLLARARRPAPALEAFRRASRTAACDPADPLDAAWWDTLAAEHTREGPHAPMQELLFREFCEFLVRLSAVRYRHVPALERRLHTLINVHLLHQVSKTKATLPPPPRTPFHMEMWAGNATSVLHAADALLRAAWGRMGSTTTTTDSLMPSTGLDGTRLVSISAQQQLPSQQEVLDTTATGGQSEPELTDLGQTLDSLGPTLDDLTLYSSVRSVRHALQLLQQLGLLSSSAMAMQAAAAMTFNYLTVNTYTYEPHRARVEMDMAGTSDEPTAAATASQEPVEGSAGQGEGTHAEVAELADADTREVLCWLDQPLLYADWVEGLARVAQVLVPPSSLGLAASTVAGGGGEGARVQDEGDGAAGLGPGGPVAGGEGALHQQLRAFLTGPGGLQQALLSAAG